MEQVAQCSRRAGRCKGHAVPAQRRTVGRRRCPALLFRRAAHLEMASLVWPGMM
jgi:hypothetical protein